MELKEGIVVKVINYQDNAKIIYLITASGKESLIVKGANNYKSHTHSYAQDLIKLGYDQKKMFLSTGKIISSFINIKNDPKRLISALKIIEIAYELIDHINDYQTFYQFLDEILSLLNSDYKYEILEIIFKVKTLYLLGVAPIFTKCVTCETKDNLVGFSFYDGGMKCEIHAQTNDNLYSEKTIAPLRTMYLVKLKDLEGVMNNLEINYQDLELFLKNYYEYYLGFKSRIMNL